MEHRLARQPEIPCTPDDFYDALVTFRDQNDDCDATNEIPFSDSWDEGYADRAPIIEQNAISPGRQSTAGADR